MIRVTVLGAKGRLGGQVVQALAASPVLCLKSACVRPEHDTLGHLVPSHGDLTYTAVTAEAFAGADVIIDSTLHESALHHAQLALEAQKPIALCMTALNDDDKAELLKISRTIPILWAPNTSLGVALMRRFAVMTAEILGPDYDVEILEMHHRGKRDAPSAPVVQIGERLNALPGFSFSLDPDRNGVRQRGDVGYASLRGGSVTADHEVFFAGDHEVFSIKHRALDRSLFAFGALKGAQWLLTQKPGFYTMDDVLGFSI